MGRSLDAPSIPAGPALRWEAGCISAELLGVAAGLYLGIGLDRWPVGGPVLVAVVVASVAARLAHYSPLAPAKAAGGHARDLD